MENYLSYLEEAFLVFTVRRFSFKLKEQLRTPRKVYVYDTGSFAPSKERVRTSEMSINFRGDFRDELDLQRLGDVFGNLVLDMEKPVKFLAPLRSITPLIATSRPE